MAEDLKTDQAVLEPESKNEKELKEVYEIGLLLLPTIAPENLAPEVDKVKDLIEKSDGVFISDESPKLKSLEYEMSKRIGNSKKSFDKGYFGWLKFEVAPSTLDELKKGLDKSDSILRYLIISTFRESTLSGHKIIHRPEVVKPIRKIEARPIKREKVEISEEEIDKSIEELVVE